MTRNRGSEIFSELGGAVPAHSLFASLGRFNLQTGMRHMKQPALVEIGGAMKHSLRKSRALHDECGGCLERRWMLQGVVTVLYRFQAQSALVRLCRRCTKNSVFKLQVPSISLGLSKTCGGVAIPGNSSTSTPSVPNNAIPFQGMVIARSGMHHLQSIYRMSHARPIHHVEFRIWGVRFAVATSEKA